MNNWISVKDRLPDKEEEYLIFAKGSISVESFIEGYSDDDQPELSWWCEWTDEDNITHWMALPEPLKEDK